MTKMRQRSVNMRRNVPAEITDGEVALVPHATAWEPRGGVEEWEEETKYMERESVDGNIKHILRRFVKIILE